MNTMYKCADVALTGRPSISTKAVSALLVLAMLVILAASFRPALKHIGEEIPQGANHRGEQIAGGLHGGVVNDNA